MKELVLEQPTIIIDETVDESSFIWCFESWKDALESDAWIWKIMFLFRLLRQCFALFWICYVI
ncbi:hypothetical protein Hanom_Chr14g01302881 [Helianthus anomalus]